MDPNLAVTLGRSNFHSIPTKPSVSLFFVSDSTQLCRRVMFSVPSLYHSGDTEIIIIIKLTLHHSCLGVIDGVTYGTQYIGRDIVTLIHSLCIMFSNRWMWEMTSHMFQLISVKSLFGAQRTIWRLLHLKNVSRTFTILVNLSGAYV